MTNNCQCNHKNESGNSSFLLGLVFGLIAAAIVAVVIYKYRHTEVVAGLRQKLEELLKKYLPQTPTSAPSPSVKKRRKLISKSFKRVAVTPITKVSSNVRRSKPKLFKVPRK
jgi:hypothetical protein